jgi:hypothetical protein
MDNSSQELTPQRLQQLMLIGKAALDPEGRWKNLTTWNEDTFPCSGTWHGVNCSADGKLTHIDLWEASDLPKGLGGTLPEEWSQLNDLMVLDLRGAQLKGTLPDSWGSMPSMRDLYLQRNQLEGRPTAGPCPTPSFALPSIETASQYCTCSTGALTNTAALHCMPL